MKEQIKTLIIDNKNINKNLFNQFINKNAYKENGELEDFNFIGIVNYKNNLYFIANDNDKIVKGFIEIDLYEWYFSRLYQQLFFSKYAVECYISNKKSELAECLEYLDKITDKEKRLLKFFGFKQEFTEEDKVNINNEIDKAIIELKRTENVVKSHDELLKFPQIFIID